MPYPGLLANQTGQKKVMKVIRQVLVMNSRRTQEKQEFQGVLVFLIVFLAAQPFSAVWEVQTSEVL